jgi:hypothetical protein
LPAITTPVARSQQRTSVSKRGDGLKMRARTQIARRTATKGRPERRFEKKVWSALQTHLQGVDRATLAIMPENCRHRAALLSRLNARSK